ncbi:MAG: ABC transporter ATP-binding protein [Solirubrobacterales bacterium]
MSAILEIRDLYVELPLDQGPRPVIHNVSLRIESGEALGLVGESGSGKSMTARAVMGLLPRGAQVDGSIQFDGEELLALSRSELNRFRSREAAMIFQDPRAHINPVRRIGDFLCEALVTNQGVRRDQAQARAVDRLAECGIPDAKRRLRQYPHELSGGLLQRVMIAAALMIEPRLLIADEPTTALDVTTQSDVMAILDELRRERGLALLFITHDLDLASAVCDRTSVMYAGSIVEDNRAQVLHQEALHPYTSALAGSRPSITKQVARLEAISGRPLSAFEAPPGCPFEPRCPFAEQRCLDERPALRELAGAHVACHRAEELRADNALTRSEVANA